MAVLGAIGKLGYSSCLFFEEIEKIFTKNLVFPEKNESAQNTQKCMIFEEILFLQFLCNFLKDAHFKHNGTEIVCHSTFH